ncbi:YnbE family lipoprotein [Lacimicrobium sp. SS2-24]|uniref:YnbE family lipoprotein n=1 Tax=Lacimicrobium sp. SS2-24 TaxID=2005569 RepID=UPI000B4B7C8F|nr:YnbE family lipoprotein [Lacimicrobium sp. SS2-24]
MRITTQTLCSVLLLGLLIGGCTHKVQVETKEPITINLNVKVDHQIRVKVDKELDELFSDDSELF